MEGLSYLEARLYVQDPSKAGVRYDVVHQIAHSYALVNRNRGKELSFVAEGRDAEKAHEAAKEIFTLPALDVCLKYAEKFAYRKAMSTKQIPHPTEPIPDLPGGLGPILKSLYEFGERHQKKQSRPIPTIQDYWRKWGWHDTADLYESGMHRPPPQEGADWNRSPWEESSWK
ncbi:hypothetical protein [Rubrobacter indicoceani]|uniref:hypothetical protein n=1 Tax=Rubrobacter indicoceani TaxID=2051957 RepID=UPI000E5BFA42|nr:hypothetical protein [Rubrobacter indicoceani]